MNAIAISPDGTTLVNSDESQTIRVWNVSSRALVTSWATADIPKALAYSLDGTTVVSGEEEGIIEFWRSPLKSGS